MIIVASLFRATMRENISLLLINSNNAIALARHCGRSRWPQKPLMKRANSKLIGAVESIPLPERYLFQGTNDINYLLPDRTQHLQSRFR